MANVLHLLGKGGGTAKAGPASKWMVELGQGWRGHVKPLPLSAMNYISTEYE
jgi:hypothetical protein